METKMQIFNNEEFGQIRTIEENGKVLFCGKDVAAALGYKNPRKAIREFCPGGTKRSIGVQTGTKTDGTPAMQQVEMPFIPEGDIYRLIVRSHLPTAQKFERWVFEEVLPSIREHGSYGAPVIDVQTITQIATAVCAEFVKQIAPLIGNTNGRTNSEYESAQIVEFEEPVLVRRRHNTASLIARLAPEIVREVEEMLCSRQYTYSHVQRRLEDYGIKISQSSIARYAKRNGLYPL